MPIGAEQWRAATGSLNAGRGFRPRPSIKPPSLCDLPSPPPSSWKGYIAAFIMLCVPLLYKVYVVGVTVMVYLCSGRAPHGVTNGPYPTGVGLSADAASNICVNRCCGMFLSLLNIVLYVTMATVPLLAHNTKRDKRQWKLTQQLHDLDLFWLNSGPGCEVMFDPTTGRIYATLQITSEVTDLHCEPQCCTSTCNPVKRMKNREVIGAIFVGLVSFMLQTSTIVVAMLLLLAGDVERNPGPVTNSELDMADHFSVSQYLKIMEDHQIKQLGGALGLDYTKLGRMNTLPCDMVAAWLREEDNVLATSGHPSWSGLVNALRKVGQTGIAEKINRERVTSSDDTTRKRPRPPEEPISSGENEPSGQRPSLDGPQIKSAHGATIKQTEDVQVCKTCSPGTKKPKYNFPYLDLSELSALEAQARQIQLCHGFDEMSEKFQDLKDAIKKSIKERNIDVKEIVDSISELSKTLEPVYTDLHQERPKLRHQFPKLLKVAPVDEVMITVSEYSSFFNYRLIERIIKSLGTEEDKVRLKEYGQDFQKYAKRTVYECPPEIGKTSSKDRLSFLIKVHHKGFEDCSLSHLEQFVIKVSEILCLPIGMLLLESVTPGCLELILQLPLVVHQTIFPLSTQQEAALAALGVTKISAGDYQYPSCRDEGGSDHKPDDKPDDAPSDSGIDTLTTILSELSELKQEMVDGEERNPYQVDFDDKAERQPSEKPSSKKNESITPLHVAAYHGRLDHIKVLLEATKEFSPLKRDQDGRLALHYAVRGHHLELLKYFVEEQGCNPTIPGAFDETPLHLAARQGDLDIVTYLVSEQGVDPMCLEGDCDGTPLHSACIGGNIEVVCFLANEFTKYLDIKDVVSDKTKNGATSLHLAAYHGHIEIMKYFVSEKNCNPNVPDDEGHTPLVVALYGGHIEIIKYLVDDCMCEFSTHLKKNEVSPFHYAALKGHLDTVKFLTKDMRDPTVRDSSGNTPLHFACHEGHIKIVKYLVSELNWDPSIEATNGATPLHFAATGGQVRILRYLINDQKCDPSQEDDKESTPLHCAADSGQLSAVRFLTYLLQNQGLDLLSKDSDGDTPLHLAAIEGHLEIVKHFISVMKCDPNTPGDNGMTPLHAAAHEGHVDIMKYLIESAKCDPMSQNDTMATPLHTAVGKGQLEAVKFLAQIKQCDPMCTDMIGFTPLHGAAALGYLDIVKFFIENLNCPADISGPDNITPMILAASEDQYHVVQYLQTFLKAKADLTQLLHTWKNLFGDEHKNIST